jgi:hypothetical protein
LPMGRLIAVLAIAGAAAVAAHPASSSRAHATAAPVAAAAVSSCAHDSALQSVERDFESRQAEVGLTGSAPLFGAEGLPKPRP